MSSVSELKPVEGEVIERMTEHEAKAITARIRLCAFNAREALEKLADFTRQAKKGEAHTVLGYASWTAYLADVLGELHLNLSRDQRREIVTLLTDEGMSTRAIAAVVSVDQKTVVNDRRATAEEISSPVMEGGLSTRAVAPVVGVAPGTVPKDLHRQVLPMEATDGENAPVVTAEVLDDPEPEASRVIGMDGKSYLRQRPEPTEERKSADRARDRQQIAERAFHDVVKRAKTVMNSSLTSLAAGIDAEELRSGAQQLRDVSDLLLQAVDVAQKSEAPVDLPGDAATPLPSRTIVEIDLSGDWTDEQSEESDL